MAEIGGGPSGPEGELPPELAELFGKTPEKGDRIDPEDLTHAIRKGPTSIHRREPSRAFRPLNAELTANKNTEHREKKGNIPAQLEVPEIPRVKPVFAEFNQASIGVLIRDLGYSPEILMAGLSPEAIHLRFEDHPEDFRFEHLRTIMEADRQDQIEANAQYVEGNQELDDLKAAVDIVDQFFDKNRKVKRKDQMVHAVKQKGKWSVHRSQPDLEKYDRVIPLDVTRLELLKGKLGRQQSRIDELPKISAVVGKMENNQVITLDEKKAVMRYLTGKRETLEEVAPDVVDPNEKILTQDVAVLLNGYEALVEEYGKLSEIPKV